MNRKNLNLIFIGLSIASEIVGIFRDDPLCYGCKVVIDAIKETTKIYLLS